jgi:hypothetical protein
LKSEFMTDPTFNRRLRQQAWTLIHAQQRDAVVGLVVSLAAASYTDFRNRCTASCVPANVKLMQSDSILKIKRKSKPTRISK